jgi:hypothetical protein
MVSELERQKETGFADGKSRAARGAEKIPSNVLRALTEMILSQTREPWGRVAASLPEGVTATTVVDASALSVTYTFVSELMGELGRLNARFTGDNLSLSQLYCGLMEGDDDYGEARRAIMRSIYDRAKEAFAV